MLYSGVDLHRRLIVICTVDDNGAVVARCRMKTDPALVSEYFITDLPFSPYQPGFADFLNQCQIPEEYRMTLMLYHQQCLQVTEHRNQLEKHFKAHLRTTPAVQLLMSLPGIGDITGSIIAMETGDIHRFADAKHYCSYCRLVPGAKDSGGKHSHRSGSKDGNQYLKFAFTESAIKAMRFYPEIKHFLRNWPRSRKPVRLTGGL